MLKPKLLLAFFLGWSQIGLAFSDGNWNTATLMQQLSQVKEARADFQETKNSSLLTTPLKTRGQLIYRAPSYLEKRITHPYRESLRIENNTMIRESPDGKRQTLSLAAYPAAGALVESFRATLAGDLSALQRFYRVELHGDKKQWQLLLLPKDPEISETIHAIRVYGRDHTIYAIHTQEASGDSSQMSLTRIVQ